MPKKKKRKKRASTRKKIIKYPKMLYGYVLPMHYYMPYNISSSVDNNNNNGGDVGDGGISESVQSRFTFYMQKVKRI